MASAEKSREPISPLSLAAALVRDVDALSLMQVPADAAHEMTVGAS